MNGGHGARALLPACDILSNDVSSWPGLSRVMAPANVLPANAIQSEALIPSPPAIPNGIITTIVVPSTIASEFSHSGLSPGKFVSGHASNLTNRAPLVEGAA